MNIYYFLIKICTIRKYFFTLHKILCELILTKTIYIMKKIILLVVAVLCFTVAASAKGESVKQAFGIDNNARCAAGLRLGSGAQVVGEYFYG